MKKNIQYIIMVLPFLLCSCLKESREGDFNKESISATIKLKLTLPDGVEAPFNGIKVKFIEQNTGIEYTGIADDNGDVNIDVTYGTYTGTTNSTIKQGNVLNVYNGATEKIRITPKDPKVIEAMLNLKYSKSGDIIIKEFYYAGCWSDETGKAYSAKDQYFTLYNNTTETTYLDSICVGAVDPMRVSGEPNWYKQGTKELRDSVPCATMVWMFKGTGKSLPLAPGEEVVCSLNAINHTLIVKNSVNLGKPGYFALFAPGITTVQSTPEAGVNTLELIWRTGTAKAFTLPVNYPRLVIFKLGGKYNRKNQLRKKIN